MARGKRCEGGFSLVELLTVMAIMSILMSVATLQFNRMQVKSNIEKEVQTIYANLMSVRLEALYTKTPRIVTLVGRQMNIYPTDVTTTTPVTITLAYPVTMSGSSNRVEFDASGMMLKAERSICVDPSGTLADNRGNVDSVDVSTAKIYMGKRQSGAICDPTKIDQK